MADTWLQFPRNGTGAAMHRDDKRLRSPSIIGAGGKGYQMRCAEPDNCRISFLTGPLTRPSVVAAWIPRKRGEVRRGDRMMRSWEVLGQEGSLCFPVSF